MFLIRKIWKTKIIFELKKCIKEYEIKLKKAEENLTNMMKENLYLRNYLNQRKTFEVLEEERNISLKYLPINFQNIRFFKKLILIKNAIWNLKQ